MTDGPARRALAGILHRDHDAATTDRLLLAWQAELETELRASIEAELLVIATMRLPNHLIGTFNVATYREAWLWCRAVVRGEHPKPYDLDVTDPRAAALPAQPAAH